MGKNKKKIKKNVFKVAGAKSLKKTKAKEVVLGLKPVKKKIEEIDKEFLEIQSNNLNKPDSLSKTTIGGNPIPKKTMHTSEKSIGKSIVSKRDIAETSEQMVKMDL